MTVTPFQRIAVATDGSSTADSAVEVAIDLARRYGADLLVVAIAPPPQVFATPNAPFVPVEIPARDASHYRGVVDAAAQRARAAGVTSVSGVSDEGPAVEGILAQVTAHRSDLLVVGSRGLSTAQRLLLGSVSTGLATHAPCPVLVVRQPTPPA